MKMMIDRARDLFRDNPNQTVEGAVLILQAEYAKVAAKYGVTPESLHAQCLECANLVVEVIEFLRKDKRHVS